MEVRFDESETVVVDIGTGFIKAGYSGEDLPRVVIPTVIGEKITQVEDTVNSQGGEMKPKITHTFGHIPYEQRDDLTLYQPIQRGLFTDDIDRLGQLLEHIFAHELNVDSRSMNVLMTDCPLTKKDDKIKLATLMFEQFKVKSFALQNTAVLSLFSTGTTTGLVAEVGEGVTYTVPVFEGYALPHALYTMDVSGMDITNKLIADLEASGTPVNGKMYDSIRKAKEQMCSVAMDYHDEIQMREDPLSDEQRSYELPTGEIIQIAHDKRITAAEVIFQPSILDVRHAELGECLGGVANLAFKSIEKCDQDLKMSLYNNIVLAGGTTLMKRFPERFEYELKSLTRGDAKTDIKVH